MTQEITATDRKQKRRDAAEKRRRLKPLSDEVRKLEYSIEKRRGEIGRLEKVLADPGIYTDASRKEELTGLLREQADLRLEIESLESAWLEASEALESARQALTD